MPTTKTTKKKVKKTRKKPGPKVGATYKDKDTVLQKLEEAFRRDCTVNEACAHAGVAPSTYHLRVSKDQKLSERMYAAKQRAFIQARKVLVKGITEGDQKSAIEYLKKRDKRYKDRVEEDVNVKGDMKMVINIQKRD